MSFPPEFLDEVRLRTGLADAIGRRVVLTRKGREHVGLCPFHKEKTPSFTVNEDKGFFHCFGCGAHGDIIGFEMRLDNLTFPEAVERLARSANIELPSQSPDDQRKAEERKSLYAVIETACVWFESQLAAKSGGAARDYLTGRGVAAPTAALFRLGWAPNSRHALKQALVAKGIEETALVEAGLLVKPEDGGAPYDRFRGRIIFPITDRGGRVVAFGGRGMGDAVPKYLNSPDSPLFHKGRLLYGLALARKPARDRGEVIVAEGYMDVIALHRAGFENAVAPLGTALTEDQMAELWRLVPEPLICFDGDDAGRRAAYRAVERALVLLTPGRSLRFVALPAGEDPDSLIASEGAAGLRRLLERARPLAEMLWDKEIGNHPIDTPERRAGMEKRLLDAAKKIQDPSVRRRYEEDIRDRLWKAFRGNRFFKAKRGGAAHNRWDADHRPEPKTFDPLGTGTTGRSDGRDRLLVAMIVVNPELLGNVAEEFAGLEIAKPELDKLRRAILDASVHDSGLDSETLKRHLTAQGFSSIIDRLLTPKDWSARRLEDRLVRPGGVLPEIERGWRHVVSRHARVIVLEDELKAAQAVLDGNLTEETYARCEALRRQIELVAGEDAELRESEPGS